MELNFRGIQYASTRDSLTHDRSLQERVAAADVHGAFAALVSIHHNGLPLGDQGTEIRWCNDSLKSNGIARGAWARTDTLARKVLYNLLDVWGYRDRCKVQNQSKPIEGCIDCGNVWILKNVNLAHVLTEASNLNNFSEEELFIDQDRVHISEEAIAIADACRSYIDRQGFGRLEYFYIGDVEYSDLEVLINDNLHEIPYERTWPLFEHYSVAAHTGFCRNGVCYDFHHWSEYEYTTGELIWQYPVDAFDLNITVPVSFDNYHYFRAYYKGGPFDFNFQLPHAGITHILQNSIQPVEWAAPIGVFDACSVRVAFSSNGGGSWQQLLGPVHFHHHTGTGVPTNVGNFNWQVPNIISNNCKLRLIAWDFVDNMDTLISHTFGIGTPVCQVPVARFAASFINGSNNYPQGLQFADQSSQTPIAWAWDFGNTRVSTYQNPVQYFYPGTYSIRLTATNSCGADDTLRSNWLTIANCDLTTPDPDGDGRGNICDNCDNRHNPLQEDANFDGVGDACCCIGTRGNVDNSTDQNVDISDLTYLVDHLFISQIPLGCQSEANLDGSSGEGVDISDLTVLVDYLFIGNYPLLACP